MKSWKTTIVGLLLAILYAIQPFLENQTFDWKRFLVAVLIAALGVLSKDFNVSGGESDKQ